MISDLELSLRSGSTQALAAISVAVLTAALIAIPTWDQNPSTGRFAFLGVLVFCLALAIGSSRTVGVASLPILSSAFITSATSAQTEWIQSIVVGCLWYLAVELAWESIGRRTSAQRSVAASLRRINEVSTVVVVALALTVVAFAGATFDATRTINRQIVVIAALTLALWIAVRQVIATSPSTPKDDLEPSLDV